MIENRKIFDANVYVGQFREEYYSPEDVSRLMKERGVDYYVASSATARQGDYGKALSEIRKLIELDGKKVYPSLMLNSALLQDLKSLDIFLNSGIQWRCLEFYSSVVDNGLEGEEYLESCKKEGEKLRESISIARRLNVPLFLNIDYEISDHNAIDDFTKRWCRVLRKGGWQRECNKVIKEVKDVNLILPGYGYGLLSGNSFTENIWVLTSLRTGNVYSSVMSSDEYIVKALSSRTIWTGVDLYWLKHQEPQIDLVETYKGAITEIMKDDMYKLLDNSDFLANYKKIEGDESPYFWAKGIADNVFFNNAQNLFDVH